MELDLVGIWDGMFYTDGLWFTPNLFTMKGQYVGGDGFGGPSQNASVGLEVLWQGEYKTFYYSLKVAPFYGDLVGVQIDSIPVSGFINTYGFVKFSLYTDRPAPPARIEDTLDWGFTGYVTTRGSWRTLAGNWSKTSWNEGVLSYQLGKLSVRRRVSFWERASRYVKALGGLSRNP
jgi:hypothetical protein